MKFLLCRALVILLALGGLNGLAGAQSYGYSVNSRGFLPDDQMHLLWRINLATGQSEAIGPTRFDKLEALALLIDGTLVGADDASNTLVNINKNSGFSSPVGGILNNMGLSLQNLDFGMTAACDGNLLAVSAVQQNLFQVSLDSGLFEQIGEPGSLGAPIVGIAARGNQLYGIGQGLTINQGNHQPLAPNLYRIDRESASAELIGALGPLVAPYINAGLAFDSEGRLWALTDRRDNGQPDLFSQVIEIDLSSGQAINVINADVVGFESLAIAPPGGCEATGGGAPGDFVPVIPVNHPVALGLLIVVVLLLAAFTLARKQES